MYVCVCMYVCMYVFMYVFMYVSIYMYVCMCICMYVYVYVYVYMYVCTYVRMNKYNYVLQVAVMKAAAKAFGISLSGEVLATACQWVENQVCSSACGLMDQVF